MISIDLFDLVYLLRLLILVKLLRWIFAGDDHWVQAAVAFGGPRHPLFHVQADFRLFFIALMGTVILFSLLFFTFQFLDLIFGIIEQHLRPVEVNNRTEHQEGQVDERVNVDGCV